MSNKKKLVYKYTVKLTKDAPVDTHYVLAYTEELARAALSQHLNVKKEKLRFSPKNLPYKIRKAIFDKDNKDYQLTLDVKKRPTNETSVEERKANAFDLKASKLKSLKYKVKALYRYDKELLLEYSDFDMTLLKQYGGYSLDDLVDKFTYGFQAFENAYTDLQFQIRKEGFENETVDGINIVELLAASKPLSLYH